LTYRIDCPNNDIGQLGEELPVLIGKKLADHSPPLFIHLMLLA
jgi:hypothetical protein